MKGFELFDKAVNLMGLQDQERETNKYAETCVKSVYNDLAYKLNGSGFKSIDFLNEEIPLDDRVLNDVAVYGVAMFLAMIIMDGEKQMFFTELYNQKRLSLSSIVSVEDVLPTPSD